MIAAQACDWIWSSYVLHAVRTSGTHLLCQMSLIPRTDTLFLGPEGSTFEEFTFNQDLVLA